MKRPDKTDLSGRYRRLQFSPHFLVDLCKEGSGVRCMNGVPSDAEVVEVFLSDGGVTVTIRSESFSPVEEGEKIPAIKPTFIDHT
jgi:hypothetical protein